MAQLVGFIVFILAMLGFGIYIGPAVVSNPLLIVALAVGGFILLLSLTRFDLTLMFLLVIIPFSVQANLEHLGEAPVDFGIDDFFIICLIFTWIVYLSKHKKTPFVPSPLGVPFVIYFTTCVISFIPMVISGRGNFVLSAFHLAKWFEYVFIYYVLVSTLESHAQVVKFAKVSLGTSILIGVIQMFQIIQGIFEGWDQHAFAHRAVVTFISNGILGAFHVLFLTIFVSLFLKYKNFKTRFLLGIAIAILTVGIFYSFARSAYIGLFISLVFLGFFNRKNFTMAIFIFLCCIPAMSIKVVKDRVMKTVTVDQRQLKKYGIMKNQNNIRYMARHRDNKYLDLSSMERLRNWRRAEAIIRENLIWGTGYWSIRFLGVFGFSTAHNFFITTTIETGVLGLLAFLWMSWSLVYHCLRFAKNTQDPFYQAIANGLAAGYLGVLTHSFFGETFEDFHLTGPLWMLCGIVFAAKRIDEKTRQMNLVYARKAA